MERARLFVRRSCLQLRQRQEAEERVHRVQLEKEAVRTGHSAVEVLDRPNR